MAIVCRERPRQATESHYLRPGGTRDYVISGTREKLSAQLAVINTAPMTDTGYDIDGNEMQLFLDHITIKECGQGVWEAVVKYEASTDVTDLQFMFGATTAKIYQALEHIKSYDCKNGGIDTDDIALHNGVIGVNGDEVEGVDIEVSTIDFVITKKRYRATLPADYFQVLIDIMDLRTPINDGTRVVNGAGAGNTGLQLDGMVIDDEQETVDDLFEVGQLQRTNNQRLAENLAQNNTVNEGGGGTFTFIWKGLSLEFPEGSLRLRGIPIKWTSNNEVEISYHFSYQRPITEDDNFTIGASDKITKEGWEYGWIHYKLEVENGRTIRTPESFNVEQVYPKRNFNVLDL